MESVITAVQELDTIDFDRIDAPSCVDFEKENYIERESDLKWFAALQPHLRTPAFIVAKEAKSERARASSLRHLISETPTVKQRTKCAAKQSSEYVANKLDFSSSSEDEIMEKLKAHNKRIQNKGQRTPPLKQPVQVITSNPKVSSKQVKRRSCAPLLFQKKLALNLKKPSSFESVNESLVTAIHSPPTTSSQQSRESPINSVSSKTADKRRSCVPFLAHNKGTAKNGTSNKPLSEVKNCSSDFSSNRQSKKVAQKSTTRPSTVIKNQSIVTKSNYKAVMKPSTRPESSENKTKSDSENKTKSISKSTSENRTKHVTKSDSQNKTKPVIKSTSSSSRPSSSVSNKPKIGPLPSKTKPVGLKNKVKTTTSSAASSSISQKSTSSSIRSKPRPPRPSSQRRQPATTSEDPFHATSSVLSIINSKTPRRSRVPVKGKEARYSVETPSPPQSYILENAGNMADEDESSDDLDTYMMEKLKAHNAKIMSNIRVPGKATKTPRQVSLHLGSPSRPKTKVSRSKLS